MTLGNVGCSARARLAMVTTFAASWLCCDGSFAQSPSPADVAQPTGARVEQASSANQRQSWNTLLQLVKVHNGYVSKSMFESAFGVTMAPEPATSPDVTEYSYSSTGFRVRLSEEGPGFRTITGLNGPGSMLRFDWIDGGATESGGCVSMEQAQSELQWAGWGQVALFSAGPLGPRSLTTRYFATRHGALNFHFEYNADGRRACLTSIFINGSV